MRKTFPLLLLLVSWVSLAFLPPAVPITAAPSPLDVIAAVNDLRAQYGLLPLTINTPLMVSAQSHADYLASVGSNNIVNGHAGADGSDSRDRAIAAGYPVTTGVDVQDCWAYTSNQVPVSTLFSDSNIWNDPIHMSYILHKNGIDVGAGVTEKDGMIYYDLVISFTYGSSVNTSTTPLPTSAKKTTTPKVAPVQVSTPEADGSIRHVVQAGEAVWSIAVAYGTTEGRIIELNRLSSNAIIYEGETLLIRPAYTPTPSPTVTLTPRPPTRTPIPPQLAETLDSNSAAIDLPSLGGLDRTTIGLILVLVCGIGLVLIIMGTLHKGK